MSGDVVRMRPAHLSGGLPWLGHALQLGRDPVGFLERGRMRCGNVFSFKLLGQEAVFLCGSDAHEAVFRSPDSVLSAREAYKFMTPLMGDGVAYGAEPEVMDEQLSLIRPALTARRLQAYAQTVEAETIRVVESWGAAGVVNAYEEMNRLTVAGISRCFFGDQVSPDMLEILPGLYRDLGSGIRFGGLVNPHLPLPQFKRRDRARARLVALIGGMMRERRVCSEGQDEDFLDTLLQARRSDGTALSDDLIAGLILTLIFAGQHTTASLATWTGVLLLRNRHHLPAVLAEQAELFRCDSLMTTQKLHRMELLDRCVKEAERLHPPIMTLMRIALQPFHFQGFVVSPGTVVVISPGVSHRIPEVFRDPAIYDPDRFGPDRAEDRLNPNSLIGFGGGKHRCMGAALAYLQTKVIWSTLLRTFELAMPQQTQVPQRWSLTSMPRQPCDLRFLRRSVPGGPV